MTRDRGDKMWFLYVPKMILYYLLAFWSHLYVFVLVNYFVQNSFFLPQMTLSHLASACPNHAPRSLGFTQ